MKVTDGQIDFFGLLNEYTDSQGAVIRVKEPGKAPKKSISDSVGVKVKTMDGEQMKLNLDAMQAPVLKTEIKPEAEIVPKPKVKPKEEIAPQPEVKHKEEKEPVAEPKPKPKEETKSLKATAEATPKELLFKQCKRCWCFDCKHNSRNEGVPREMCGSMMPCPACDGCVAEDQATICEIGNAKEGCKLRATEEGIYSEIEE